MCKWCTSVRCRVGPSVPVYYRCCHRRVWWSKQYIVLPTQVLYNQVVLWVYTGMKCTVLHRPYSPVHIFRVHLGLLRFAQVNKGTTGWKGQSPASPYRLLNVWAGAFHFILLDLSLFRTPCLSFPLNTVPVLYSPFSAQSLYSTSVLCQAKHIWSRSDVTSRTRWSCFCLAFGLSRCHRLAWRGSHLFSFRLSQSSHLEAVMTILPATG